MRLKTLIKKIPVIGNISRHIYGKMFNTSATFKDSQSYWENRYKSGGNSGKGSYDKFADFKAEILNDFVKENEIRSVIEYGCGDGNQLSLAHYPDYLGFDVSSEVIKLCQKRFADDKNKKFKLMREYNGETADLTLSLDVIYHLVEDRVFADYMNLLFNSSQKFVVIYSSDTDENPQGTLPHVRHRQFSNWVKTNKSEYQLIRRIPNKYPFAGDIKTGSFADFYIYSKLESLQQ